MNKGEDASNDLALPVVARGLSGGRSAPAEGGSASGGRESFPLTLDRKTKMRIVSGMRPTGPLHLGHYHGVLKNWVELQQDNDCFFFIADWHALTTEYADAGQIQRFALEMLADWLAVGLDPKKAVIFQQSQVTAHAELYLLLSMLCPVSWLERVPSYKEMQQELAGRDLSTIGFLGYPLLQAADILLYRADKVPVGADQIPHLEFAREVIRRFHHIYKQELFLEPEPLVTLAPKMLGLDRRKMSKSYNNAITLGDTSPVLKSKIMQAITDPARKRREDPGNPEICLIHDLEKLHCPREVVSRVNRDCQPAGIGCVECKGLLLDSLAGFIGEIRDKRAAWLAKPKVLQEILDEGNAKARETANITLDKVKTVMGLGCR